MRLFMTAIFMIAIKSSTNIIIKFANYNYNHNHNQKIYYSQIYNLNRLKY